VTGEPAELEFGCRLNDIGAHRLSVAPYRAVSLRKRLGSRWSRVAGPSTTAC